LEAKAEVDLENGYKATPLFEAAREGHVAVAKLLVEHKASFTREDRYRRNPFEVATESVKNLLAPGVTRILNAEKALLSSCSTGDVETAAQSIRKGAWVGARGLDGRTALMIAAEKGHLNVVENLLNLNASVNDVEIDGWRALHYACREGNLETVKVLLASRADACAVDREDFTALHAAAESGQVRVLKYLLGQGVRVNAEEMDGKTALHLAVDNGGEVGSDLVQVLLDAKASPISRDSDGRTALHWAAPFATPEMIEKLLQRGADPKMKDEKGWNALHCATSDGNLEIVNLLIEKNADPTVPDEAGQTSVHLASAGGFVEILQIFLEEEEGKLDLDVADKSGQTALHQACAGGHDELAQLILDSNGDPLAQDKLGRSSLHAAVLGGNEFCVEIVLEIAGEEICRIRDADGKTAYQLALESENEEIAPILEPFQIEEEEEAEKNGGQEQENETDNECLSVPGSVSHSAAVLSAKDTEDANVSNSNEDALSEESNDEISRKLSAQSLPTGASAGKSDDQPNAHRSTRRPSIKSPKTIEMANTAGVGSLSFAFLGSSPLTSPVNSAKKEIKETSETNEKTQGENNTFGKRDSSAVDDFELDASGMDISVTTPVNRNPLYMSPTTEKRNRRASAPPDYARRGAGPLDGLQVSNVVRERKAVSTQSSSHLATPRVRKPPPGQFILHKRSRSSGRLNIKKCAKIMQTLDTGDPDIQRAWTQINEEKSGINWMLMTTRRNENALSLVGSGSGGLREFVRSLLPEKVMWGIVKVKSKDVKVSTQNRRTLVFFTHIGEKVGAFSRAKAAVRTPGVMKAFNNIAIHLQDNDAYAMKNLGRELLRNSSVKPHSYDFGPEQSIRIDELTEN